MSDWLTQNREWVIGVFAVVFTVVYAYAAQHLLLQLRRRRDKRRKTLSMAVSKSLLNGTVDSAHDLVNLYKGVHGLGADDLSYRAGLARALREYLVSIMTDSSLDVEEARQLKTLASDLLQQVELESPYADLPAAERNLLMDIRVLLRAGERDSATAKLEDLSGLIGVRQDAVERLQSSNKWAVPLAAVGLFLSVVFGIISLIK